MKVVTQTVVVVRDGKRVIPEIGKPFKFTAEELKELKANAPDAFREPVDESELQRMTGQVETQGEHETQGPAQGGNPEGVDTPVARANTRSRAVRPQGADDDEL